LTTAPDSQALAIHLKLTSFKEIKARAKQLPNCTLLSIGGSFEDIFYLLEYSLSESNEEP